MTITLLTFEIEIKKPTPLGVGLENNKLDVDYLSIATATMALSSSTTLPSSIEPNHPTLA